MNLKLSGAVIALLLSACATDSAIPEAVGTKAARPAAAAIAPLPVEGTVLTRIAFGSCADEELPQPIWQASAGAEPDLVLFMGDNIYVDYIDGEFVEKVTPQMISEAYDLLALHPDYSPFRSTVPILAVWDDHDFGKNDGGREFELKAQSKELMLEFFGFAENAAVRGRDGLYHAAAFGPPGRRVQIIMLDTRWFRSPLTPTDERDAPGKERYVASTAGEQIILGEAQWIWLEAQLRAPADLRLLVSSIQVLSEGHGWELWRNLPAERQRFFELVRQTKVENLVLLSGDRHVGGLYRLEGETGYPLYEITASSLNKSFSEGLLTVPEYGPHQIGHLYGPENFGLITIDWERQVLAIELKDIDGATVRALTLSLEDLKNRD